MQRCIAGDGVVIFMAKQLFLILLEPGFNSFSFSIVFFQVFKLFGPILLENVIWRVDDKVRDFHSIVGSSNTHSLYIAAEVCSGSL